MSPEFVTRKMDVTSFPTDIFDIVVFYLDLEDFITCRRVDRKWLKAFSKATLSRQVLLDNFPNALEVRNVSEDSDWAYILNNVAGRYHYLKKGTPCHTEKLPLCESRVKPDWARHHTVDPLRRQLEFEGKRAPFHYQDTLWTYEDGLLVFPSATAQKYQLYDLATSCYFDIDFEPTGKIVRRMRLCEKVLVIEWCDPNVLGEIKNDEASRHRHFATAWDVLPIDLHSDRTSRRGSRVGWTTKFRCEWKIHWFGLALEGNDRFYSTHNATNYAIYRWERSHGIYGDNGPLEYLAVYDISTPHPYRPSEDPTDKFRPLLQSSGAIKGREFLMKDLEFYNIEQSWRPRIRELQLDEGNIYFIEEDHRWLVGMEANLNLPRLHKLKSTGIPFAENGSKCDGPARVDECGADGDVHLSFCQRPVDERSPGLLPCWRHEGFPYITVTDVYDVAAGVRFTARQCFMLESISSNFRPSVRVKSPVSDVELEASYWAQLLNKGKICGDERWVIGENENNEITILYFDWEARARLRNASEVLRLNAASEPVVTTHSRPLGWRRHGSVQESGLPAFLMSS